MLKIKKPCDPQMTRGAMSRWVFLATILLVPPIVRAQNPFPDHQSDVPIPGSNRRQDAPTLPDEMRTKMELDRVNAEHKKLVDNAKELGALSSDIEKAYKQSSRLGPDEYKKLGSIEKLAKRILSDCGGTEVSAKEEVDDRPTIADAVSQLSTTAADVEKKITAETRFEVSYGVITDSNAVIRLAQYLRRRRQAD